MQEVSILLQGYNTERLYGEVSRCYLGGEKERYRFWSERYNNGYSKRQRVYPQNQEVIFPLVYTMLTSKNFERWEGKISIQQREHWSKAYYKSQYYNQIYESFFNMKAASNLGWLTGLFVLSEKKDYKAYWALLNGLSIVFSKEKNYVETASNLRLADVLKNSVIPQDKIRTGGILLIYLIFVEYFGQYFMDMEYWNQVEFHIFSGLEVYANHQRGRMLNKKLSVKTLITDYLQILGVHPVSLQKYVMDIEHLLDMKSIQEEDIKYMWSILQAMGNCIMENKREYNNLKQEFEKMKQKKI